MRLFGREKQNLLDAAFQAQGAAACTDRAIVICTRRQNCDAMPSPKNGTRRLIDRGEQWHWSKRARFLLRKRQVEGDCAVCHRHYTKLGASISDDEEA